MTLEGVRPPVFGPGQVVGDLSSPIDPGQGGALRPDQSSVAAQRPPSQGEANRGAALQQGFRRAASRQQARLQHRCQPQASLEGTIEVGSKKGCAVQVAMNMHSPAFDAWSDGNVIDCAMLGKGGGCSVLCGLDAWSLSVCAYPPLHAVSGRRLLFSTVLGLERMQGGGSI